MHRLHQALWELGLRQEDKVALVLPNCLELLKLYWASAGAGLVTVMLVEDFPRSTAGKTLKRVLRDQFGPR